MLKRDDPFTPQTKRGKRMRDYASPIIKTPLRNMVSADNIHNAPSPLGKDSQEQQAAITRKNRGLLLRSKRQPQQLMSPAIGISPKAAPVTVHSPAAVQVLRHSPSLSALAPGQGHKPSMEQMNKSFEEWMRIAADNKINAKNTWNFALIDYFSELTFLRDGDSINFQKASCTLDGCVKIYSSRVDAVVDETGRLLSGLNDRDSTGSDDTLHDADGDGDEGEEVKKRLVKKSSKSVETLEKNPDSLSIKGKIEMDGSTIDPLFKKTCADFDESAGGGTLLFNLIVDADTKVVFDSKSSALVGGDVQVRSDDSQVDASQLLVNFGQALSSIDQSSLTATLDNYSFLSSSVNVHDRLANALEKLTVAAPIEDAYENNPFENERQKSPAVMDYIDDYVDCDTGLGITGMDQQPQQQQYDIAQLAEQLVDGFAMNPASPDAFVFLEAPGRMQTTWAGVEHWKIKRVSKSSGQVPISQQPRESKKKQPYEIDFSSTDIDLEHLLTTGASLKMSTSDMVSEAVLPDDLHFSSADLCKLFTRPAWKFSQIRAVVTSSEVTNSLGHEAVEFVEQPLPIAAGNTDDSVVNAASDGPYPVLQDEGYQHDDTMVASQQALSLLSLGPTDKPLSVAFTKRAKRVDIQLLKSSLLSTLSSNQADSLSGLVRALPAQYANKTEEERRDLSIPYAFVCLLHLANEHGLALEQRPDGDLLIVK